MNSDRFDPTQALQAPEVDVERADIIRGAEEGQEEAQGPEAVGDLGVSRSKCRARVSSSDEGRRRGGARLYIPAASTGSRPGSKLGRARTGLAC